MKSILSIQSSVTFGAVGNTMASAVMAEFGHLLCRIDTVQLIAHPGHGYYAGGSISNDDFKSMLDGMMDFGLDGRGDSIMTGYMGAKDQVTLIADAIEKIRASRPQCDVLVDPAFGDHGRLYVDEDIANRITERLLPLANIITPNFFEFCRITGSSHSTKTDIINAGRDYLKRSVNMQAIVVTGCNIGNENIISDIWIDQDDCMTHDAPSLTHNNKGISGGGDLFAALLMAIKLSAPSWHHAFKDAAPLCRKIINGADKAGATDIDLQHLKTVLKDRA